MALSSAGCAGDSDWAVSETRRSTTGAFEQLGQHPIEFSCSTQYVVALSSGEAVLYSTRREAAGGLQLVQLLAEAAMELKLEVLTDSTANLGMHNRIGSGRPRKPDPGSRASWAILIEEGQYG